MMAYPANEREFSQAEMAMKLAEYFLENKSVTYADAMRVTGGSKDQVYRLLLALDRALRAYSENGRRYLCE